MKETVIKKVTARLCRCANPKSNHQYYAFSIADLADLFGITRAGVFKAIREKWLDPLSLRDIVRYANRQRERKIGVSNQDDSLCVTIRVRDLAELLDTDESKLKESIISGSFNQLFIK